MRAHGFGFMVLEFRAWDSGAHELALRVWGKGFRVEGLGPRVKGEGLIVFEAQVLWLQA